MEKKYELHRNISITHAPTTEISIFNILLAFDSPFKSFTYNIFTSKEYMRLRMGKSELYYFQIPMIIYPRLIYEI